MQNQSFVYEECIAKFIDLSFKCKEIYSVIQDSNFKNEMFDRIIYDLAEMSRRCEDYAKVFDAYKRRLEEETSMGCVYASPDIMLGKLLK